MDDAEVRVKFPNMRPVSGPPLLFRINGCGLGVCGHRDRDAETHTYVTTYCLCFLFIPVLPLWAYRVADARGGGWYFIGREPLSLVARTWSLAVLAAIFGGIGWGVWQSHLASPEYRAGVAMRNAESLVAAGNPVQAAQAYAQVATGPTSHAAAARSELEKLALQLLASGSGKDAAGALSIALANGCGPQVRPVARARVDALKQDQPRDALVLLDVLIAGQPQPELTALREELLKRVLAANPKDVDAADALALIYEARKEADNCEKVLAPVADQLGSKEGARIMGGIYSRQDKPDLAFKLLFPYADTRLKALHAAEAACNASLKRCEEQWLAFLRSGKAPEAFYKEWERLPKDKQQQKVNEFLTEKIRQDGDIKNKQQALIKAMQIVPVALDLGVARLHRAQAMDVPADRKQELEAAEKVFMSVQGVAGETDQYRLYCGQVSYWLGKQEQGRKLFDDLLAAHRRDFDTLLAVARPLREVGATTEACTLIEEAYNAATDLTKKSHAAAVRSAMRGDADDQIKWLKLAGSSDPWNEASLEYALGGKASQAGDNAAAADHLRKSLAIYAKLPRTTVSLNNAALAAFALFGVTYDKADFKTGLDMMAESVALAPAESVALQNYAHSLSEDVILGALGERLDWKALQLAPEWSLLAHTYSDEKGHAECIALVKSQPSYAKAVSMLERALVLAPQRADLYSTLCGFYYFTEDLDGLKRLQERCKASKLDVQDEHLRRLYRGELDAERLKHANAALQRQQRVLAASTGDARLKVITATELVEQMLAARNYGADVNLDQAVQHAEQAYNAEAQHATRSSLTTALLARARERIAKDEPQIAAWAEKTKRSLMPHHVLAYAVLNDAALKPKVLQNEDVRRALALLKEDGRSLPKQRGAWEWAFFQAADPDEAARVATALQHPVERIARELEEVLQPASAPTALTGCFARAAAGDAAAGRKVLEEAAKRGVPLP